MMESCDNCEKDNGTRCPRRMLGFVYPCCYHKPIVAIPEWYAEDITPYGRNLVEEGYDQAIEDAKCFLSKLEHLIFQDLKKQRFNPEPPKPDLSGISTDDLADELFRRGTAE